MKKMKQFSDTSIFFTETLVLAKSNFKITEEKEEITIYHYLVAAKTPPREKGGESKNGIVSIYTTEDIKVGATIPVYYDFFDRKHKLEKKEYNNMKWNEKLKEIPKQEQLDGQQNLFEEELPI